TPSSNLEICGRSADVVVRLITELDRSRGGPTLRKLRVLSLTLAPALLIRTSIGGSRLAISAATRLMSAKRVRSAKYPESTTPGPLLPSRDRVASERLIPRDQDDAFTHLSECFCSDFANS